MIVFETILRRWYAFAFIGVFFWAASAERGWKRALRFLAVAAIVEGTAEWMSTHSPFPFGRYDYIAASQGNELYLSNIPLFVPLSFGVVVWAGRGLAQAGLRARKPGQLIVAGALVAAAIDLVMDPITARGGRWFLGQLYQFHAHGGWFGVPWSNTLGWIGVAGVILWVDELFEHGRARVVDAVRAPTLAAAICGSFLLIALFTRLWSIALGGLAIGAVLYAATAANLREAWAEGEAVTPAEEQEG